MSALQDSLTKDILDDEHATVVERAIHNILRTDLALTTYAQIIDGLPTADTVWDQHTSKYDADHPINTHEILCDGALERARDFRANLSIDSLKLKPNLLHAFQSAHPSSRKFEMRLLELSVTTLHEIAVQLFQSPQHFHKSETTGDLDITAVTFWERPPDGWGRVVPHPTLFTHPAFQAYEQYPNGVADMVGYWAENRIVGGVTLFDHTNSWLDKDEPNVCFQSSRRRVTVRTCQLLDSQQDAIMRFLLTEEFDPNLSPLPVLPDSSNRTRIEPSEVIPVRQVYRDIWERKPMEVSPRCVMTSLNYPEKELEASIAAMNQL